MSQIKQLPPNVVNKIAAGEVVERPASVVKELVENAIDAKAKRIDVLLADGGAKRICVTDDGSGIPADQLALATASHATSKIRSDSDLFHVRTLGFRGEALASIASVSHLLIRSRTSQDLAASELEITGGESGQIAPCSGALGTSVDIRDLFYNTPVRRKFLRTTRTELGHCSEAFTRLALAHPEIHFSLTHNDRILHDLPPAQSWTERIAVFFGRQLADSLIPIENREGDVHLTGYVAHPHHSRGHQRMQYLLLNGRFIRDRSLQHALGEAYRGLLLKGRYPICFLRLELPAEQVDVNVHPTKLEVRFQDGSGLYRQLLSTLRNHFLSTDLIAPLEPEPAQRPVPGSSNNLNLTPRLATGFRRADRGTRPSFSHSLESRAATADDVQHASGEMAEATAARSMPIKSEEAPVPAIQAMNRYLVAECDNAIIVMDQHALHESILYEKLRNKVLTDKMDTQPLLVPEPVDLTASEAAAVLEARDLLAQLGIGVEPFGGETVLLTSTPAMLSQCNRSDLLQTTCEKLLSTAKTPDPRDLLDDLLHMIACKAAIKAGDPLAPEEIQSLLEQRDAAQDSHHCPHGRPTTLVFTKEELDRQFLRT